MNEIRSVIYRPFNLNDNAKVKIPPSKSLAHRMIICSALANGESRIDNVDLSEDIKATINAVSAFGVKAKYDENRKTLFINSTQIDYKDAVVDCNESGSTLRFMIPIFAALGINAEFVGKGRLVERPLTVYNDILPKKGLKIESDNGLPLKISGKLQSGVYFIAGNVSSQFISGLMLALPMLEGDSKIILTSSLESKSYIDLTVDSLKKFGIQIQNIENGWCIKGKQKYIPQSTVVEGDWSQAVFFLNYAALSRERKAIELYGLNQYSTQGDCKCIELYKTFGLDITINNGIYKAVNRRATIDSTNLKSQNIDASQIPDLVPALAVCAALSKGKTNIYNAERLRIKESNRLAAMKNSISAIGGKIEETSDGLEIEGINSFSGGLANGENDHRVLMALSAAALRSNGDIVVTDSNSINKSYPAFYEDYNKIGGKANVVNMG